MQLCVETGSGGLRTRHVQGTTQGGGIKAKKQSMCNKTAQIRSNIKNTFTSFE